MSRWPRIAFTVLQPTQSSRVGWSATYRTALAITSGVAGTRKLTAVSDRPLIGTIIKPSIGLSPQQTTALAKTLAEAGLDFIKDDELMASPPHSPFDQRVEAVMRVLNDHTQRTGKKVMYAFNVSDEVEPMLRHYEKVVQAGGTCAMVSLNSVGLAGVKRICDLGVLAIHGHRNGWGMLNRHPLLGIAFAFDLEPAPLAWREPNPLGPLVCLAVRSGEVAAEVRDVRREARQERSGAVAHSKSARNRASQPGPLPLRGHRRRHSGEERRGDRLAWQGREGGPRIGPDRAGARAQEPAKVPRFRRSDYVPEKPDVTGRHKR